MAVKLLPSCPRIWNESKFIVSDSVSLKLALEINEPLTMSSVGRLALATDRVIDGELFIATFTLKLPLPILPNWS